MIESRERERERERHRHQKNEKGEYGGGVNRETDMWQNTVERVRDAGLARRGEETNEC